MISLVKVWVGNCARGTILGNEGMTMKKTDGVRMAYLAFMERRGCVEATKYVDEIGVASKIESDIALRRSHFENIHFFVNLSEVWQTL
jgi:hypothetical protein